MNLEVVKKDSDYISFRIIVIQLLKEFYVIGRRMLVPDQRKCVACVQVNSGKQ